VSTGESHGMQHVARDALEHTALRRDHRELRELREQMRACAHGMHTHIDTLTLPLSSTTSVPSVYPLCTRSTVSEH
jgi:hypothetical protein